MLLLSFVSTGGARAANYSVLYSFKANEDGATPNGGLLLDKSGNMYGTTGDGGINTGYGTVFTLSPERTEMVLYSFKFGSDGANPNGGLIADAAANLYGTTNNGGGKRNQGIFFKLAPNDTETILYTFCSKANCIDGASPNGGLIANPKGGFYGTTYIGGTIGDGTVFTLAANGTEKVLYSFCSASNCSDGALPVSLIESGGTFYGTTFAGGTNNNGTIFKLVKNQETVLYPFKGGSDGTSPGSLILDKLGNFYGTTWVGGAYGKGTIFKLTADGVETVLYSFKGGSDGENPEGLITDANGNFYGTTYEGGAAGCNSRGCGTVFEFSAEGVETVLYAFCSVKDCKDGAVPGGLTLKGNGLYGTASAGGKSGEGVVFRLEK